MIVNDIAHWDLDKVKLFFLFLTTLVVKDLLKSTSLVMQTLFHFL